MPGAGWGQDGMCMREIGSAKGSVEQQDHNRKRVVVLCISDQMGMSKFGRARIM